MSELLDGGIGNGPDSQLNVGIGEAVEVDAAQGLIQRRDTAPDLSFPSLQLFAQHTQLDNRGIVKQTFKIRLKPGEVLRLEFFQPFQPFARFFAVRRQLLDVKKEDLREVAQRYLVEGMKDARIVVLGEKKDWVSEESGWSIKKMELSKASESVGASDLSPSDLGHS